MEEYSITADNIYNMGGKGCLLGQCQKTRRIFTKDSNGPRDGQDGNREWITILAAICADGTALSPAIIVPPLLVPPTDGHRMSLDWLGLSKYLIRRREIKLEDGGGFYLLTDMAHTSPCSSYRDVMSLGYCWTSIHLTPHTNYSL